MLPPTNTLPETIAPDFRRAAREALDQVRRELLDERNGDAHWTGELAPSALSTATAISALAAVWIDRRGKAGDDHDAAAVNDLPVDLPAMKRMIDAGMDYLRRQQNQDGGFGDTDRSHSNIATSYLALAASTLAEKVGGAPLDATATSRLNQYLDRAGRLDGLRARYGKDKTFVVPIMNNLAIAGLISWDDVAALPFEAAVFPQSMYRFLQMPVVSYAIPALVAIGQARHFLGKRSWFPIRSLRSLCINRTLRVLSRMQPASGGYLEATPLTAFVVMSLAATGRSHLVVVANGLRFLQSSMLAEGSWPIDTNLATWVTSLSIHALACDPDDDASWYSDDLARWHLECQHRTRHPFTGAEPGGWGWTDLSGAVPDSDDTPAALLAIDLMKPHASAERRQQIDDAAKLGIGWLLRLQNRNGGWPTFCRGWGKLPFDRSSTDLTGHAMRAIRVWGLRDGFAPRQRIDRAMNQATRFLSRQQNADGSWHPLWFGNQDLPDESNPIYGTSKVLIAGAPDTQARQRAVTFLLSQQNADGGWGGGRSVNVEIRKRVPTEHVPDQLTSSIEESALAVEALCTILLRSRESQQTPAVSDAESRALNVPERSELQSAGLKHSSEAFHRSTLSAYSHTAAGNAPVLAAILGGVDFLIQSIADQRHRVAWPIGFYFAKLWYHERLYPLIFTAAALGKFLRLADEDHRSAWPN